MDSELLYRQVGRLIETMPNLEAEKLSDADHAWLGRAAALLQQTGNLLDSAEWAGSLVGLEGYSRFDSVRRLKVVLYRVLAAAELKAPAGARGAFIPVGSSFDAFAALAKVIQAAKRDVLIVDPYMDEAVLTEYGTTVPSGATLRLLSDTSKHKSTLLPAANNWAKQYGSSRPLSLRLAAAGLLHDRVIFIDGVTAWTVTQSFKDFAKKSPAEIVRADDTASLKIVAYESIWLGSQIVI